MKWLQKRKPFPNKQSRKTAHKPGVDRLKITLVALFPALWLLTSTHSVHGSNGASGSAVQDRSTCNAECGKPCGSRPLSADISAPPFRSRFGSQMPESTSPPLKAEFPSCAIERVPVPVFAQRETLLTLARSWQFACRAALDPRAPSSVS